MTSPAEHLAFLKGRRSVRVFDDAPVEEETLARLVETAAWAPSAGNRQDWFFTVVTCPTTKSAMAEAVRRRWNEIVKANSDLGVIDEIRRYSSGFASFDNAPAVIVVSARKTDALQEQLLGKTADGTVGSITSAAMAAQTLMLAAHAVGLGSCCMTGAIAAREELARVIGLDRRQQIICLVTVGRPARLPAPPARKPVTEVMRIIR